MDYDFNLKEQNFNVICGKIIKNCIYCKISWLNKPIFLNNKLYLFYHKLNTKCSPLISHTLNILI